MSQLEKNSLYDNICSLLTDYENNKKVGIEDFYIILVEISKKWELLTGETLP